MPDDGRHESFLAEGRGDVRWRGGRGDVCSVIGGSVAEVRRASSHEFIHIQSACTHTHLAHTLKPLKGITPHFAL